ncbi:MAG: DUF1643 domain-containing protein [Paludibacter sp.]
MENKYLANALFYEKNGYKFRKYLDLKLDRSTKKSPDIMVIMMNPGSSEPENGVDNNSVESLAKQDSTQHQIKQVLLNLGFEFARILNLSDLREPKSYIFYSKIKELELNGICHSIFDLERVEEFEELFVRNVPVILAWGVNKKLRKLAENAISRINDDKTYGISKKGDNYAYYHPLPPNQESQRKWVKDIIDLMRENS